MSHKTDTTSFPPNEEWPLVVALECGVLKWVEIETEPALLCRGWFNS